jgi:hypothetical protein
VSLIRFLPVVVALAAGAQLGCWRYRDPDPIYRPTQNVLEVVAVLRLHIDDDTYRFPPARDFTGKNVYRATLDRLESLEEIHEAKFRSGYVLDVLLFSKGRALERVGEYRLAAQHYERVTDLESVLAEEAVPSKHVCLELEGARGMQPEEGATVQDAFLVFDDRGARLQTVLAETEGTHYAPVVREEIERGDVERARYFRARRGLNPALEGVVVQQYQLLVQDHRESKLRNRHMLELADLYSELAHDYAHRYPPASLGFDPATFDEYAFGATRLYEAVAHQDGAVEKVEAARKLEALLAFSLGVRDAVLVR